MKELIICKINNSLTWVMNLDSDRYLSFKGSLDYKILNPIYYNKYSEKDPSYKVYNSGEKYRVVTSDLILLYTGKDEYDPFNQLGEVHEVVNNFGNFIKFKFNNFNIDHERFSCETGILSYTDIDNIQEPTDILSERKFNSNFSKIWPVINWGTLKGFHTTDISKFSYHMYQELALEALKDIFNHYYRRAILTIAMSLEVYLAYKFDNKYELAKNSQLSNSRFNIIEEDKKNKKVKLDPIYEFLANRGNFGTKLVELPLYVFGKSLKDDNTLLYSSALRLYGTRNKIVHEGKPNNNLENYISLDAEGAVLSFNILVDIMKWMGDENFNKMKTVSPVTTIDTSKMSEDELNQFISDMLEDIGY